MTESSESRTESTDATPEPRHGDQYDRPSRLNQALAWLGIVVGVVFLVAVIFFSGVFVGARTGWGWDRDDYDGKCSRWCQAGPGGMTAPGQMGSSGMMAPGMMAPGMMGPGQMGPGGPMGTGQQSPTTTVPTTSRP